MSIHFFRSKSFINIAFRESFINMAFIKSFLNTSFMIIIVA